MKTRARLFAFYFSAAFTLATLGFHLLKILMPGRDVFGSSFRMFLYHEDHPIPYITVVALIYAVVAAFAVCRWRHLAGWRRRLLIVGIIFASITIASVPGGMLWVVHDMMAGYVPPMEGAIDNLLWGAGAGLQIGWIVIGTSFPYSILGSILGYVVTDHGFGDRQKES